MNIYLFEKNPIIELW